MQPAFNIALIISKTNQLYAELRDVMRVPDFMGRTAKRDYGNRIETLWETVLINKGVIINV